MSLEKEQMRFVLSSCISVLERHRLQELLFIYCRINYNACKQVQMCIFMSQVLPALPNRQFHSNLQAELRLKRAVRLFQLYALSLDATTIIGSTMKSQQRLNPVPSLTNRRIILFTALGRDKQQVQAFLHSSHSSRLFNTMSYVFFRKCTIQPPCWDF
ncbi:Hypothetical_protein [Hexamita inflata]|uniref:Hypothetical_protein n=1 Tax=Hexamita inflata TaxID=28002 RepID=A0AA86QB99_9EUKA|nr:Hypothetical protein HINF_LOCUS37417 [Hexamita inflata]